MKQILLVGDTQNIRSLISQILICEKGTCLHDTTIFSAIKSLYGKKIDTVIISSREINKTNLDFCGLLKDRFSSLKIYISYDNGVNTMNRLPENMELITPENAATLIA